MTDWKLPWDGACRSGGVGVRVTAAPLVTLACHCRGCQRLTASAYSLSIAVPADGFEVVRGAPVIGALHGPSRHYYCDHCKSWMFTRPEGLDQLVNVRSTMLDDVAWFVPFVETARAEGFPFTRPSGGKVNEYHQVKSGLKVKSEQVDEEGTQTTYYLDYKPGAGNLMYPNLIKQNMGPQMMELKFQSVEINTNVSEDMFK